MPCGQTHDWLTIKAAQLMIPMTLAGNLLFMPVSVDTVAFSCLNAAIASLSCVVSGLYLSPDLDSAGYLHRRYGRLKFLWLPYYRLCHCTFHYRVRGKATHRTFLAHTPILGTLSRVMYLAIPALLICMGLRADVGAFSQSVLSYPGIAICVLGGLEVGAAVHYVADSIWTEQH